MKCKNKSQTQVKIYLSIFILFLISNSSLSSQEFLSKQKSKFSPVSINLPDVPVYYQNWMKYYHASGEGITEPSTFFQNNAYYHQNGVKLSNYKNEMQNGRRKYIPAKSDFYIVVYNNTVNIYSERIEMVQHQMDSLDISHILDIPEDQIYEGGVRDLGVFKKAGYCVELLLNSRENDNSMKEYWVFCLDSKKEKDIFLSFMIQLKLRQQRSKGIFISADMIKDQKMEKKEQSEVPDRDDTVNNPLDGYWILMQDWTDCSLKCGGGTSYQQWQCIPPKKGGKPCEGKPLRKKPCNTQPCPSVSILIENANKTHPESLNPIIKTGTIFSRPNRYSKCEVKESDALLSSIDPETKNKIKIPVRIVMNNFTISLYQDDSSSSLIHSFLLDKSDLLRDKEFCCFNLKDSRQVVNICGFQNKCHSDNKKAFSDDISPFVVEWERDFKTFKVDCRVGRDTTLITPDDENALNQNLRKKMNQVRMDVIGQRRESIRNGMIMDSLPGGKTYKKKFDNVQDLSMKAVQKELNLEKMIEDEEKLREEYEINELEKKIAQEKEKTNFMNQNIEEKELDEMFALDQHDAEKDIQRMKTEAVQNIQESRKHLMQKIANMKKKTSARKAQLASQLTSLRRQMTQTMLKAGKVGTVEHCRKGFNDANFRVKYCDKVFIEDFVQNIDCKNDEFFCDVCCENEFGNAHMDKREDCYNVCDEMEKTAELKKQ